jgi:hypothetical protein
VIEGYLISIYFYIFFGRKIHFCHVRLLVSNKFGIGQRVGSEATRTLIERSIEYMQTVWSDEKYLSTRDNCRNLHEE